MVKQVNTLENYQNILFPYAYNILGSSEDAKDSVQDVISSFLQADKNDIENIKGYLIKSVINQSINIKKRRTKTVNNPVWLPEPFSTEDTDDNINLRDIASYSMLVLLEQLNPKERAVFILKEGFAYSHEEIAEVLSGTVHNSRKLLSRAKSKINNKKYASGSTNTDVKEFEILDNYINAIRSRDVKKLEEMLSQEILTMTDGGDKINVIKQICMGRKEVMDLLIFTYHRFNASSPIAYSIINHQPALLYFNGKTLQACQIFTLSENEGQVVQIDTVLDPEKLQNIKAFRD